MKLLKLGNHQFHIAHNTHSLFPKLLHTHYLQFLSGQLYQPGEISYNGSAKSWGERLVMCIMGNMKLWI